MPDLQNFHVKNVHDVNDSFMWNCYFVRLSLYSHISKHNEIKPNYIIIVNVMLHIVPTLVHHETVLRQILSTDTPWVLQIEM